MLDKTNIYKSLLVPEMQLPWKEKEILLQYISIFRVFLEMK